MGPTKKEIENASMAFLTYRGEKSPVIPGTVFCIAQDFNTCLHEGYGLLPAGSWQVIWGPVLVTMLAREQANLTFVAQCISDPSTYIVATRGTVGSDLLEWLKEDLDVAFIDWPMPYPMTPSPKVSHATANALRIVLNAVPATNPPAGFNPLPGAGQRLVDFLASLASSGPIEICFTGHSLGGAISPALALWFRQAQGEASIPHNGILSPMPAWDPDCNAMISCVSFAGATPGDTEFCNYFAGLMGPNYDRIYNTYDIVPYAFSQLNAMPGLYGGVAEMKEDEKMLLDAIQVDVDAAEALALAKYATLPNDNPFTGGLETSLTNYLDQAGHQHVQPYRSLFGLPPEQQS